MFVLPYQKKKDSCFELVFACPSNMLITSFPHKCLQPSKRHVKTDIVIKACTAFSTVLLGKQTNKQIKPQALCLLARSKLGKC